jgi:hypothetical protein
VSRAERDAALPQRATPNARGAFTSPGVSIGPVAGIVACNRVVFGALAASPIILEVTHLGPPARAANRWPKRPRGRDHEVAVVVLRAHVYPHVPCRGEVDLEAVQLRDQLLAHRRVDDAPPPRRELRRGLASLFVDDERRVA